MGHYILVGIGWSSLALGTMGIFVPLLPTTPFYLLASFCFLRTSPTIHEKLMMTPVFGEIVRNYAEGRGMKQSHKAKALISMYIMMGISAWSISSWMVTCLFGFIASCITIYIWHIPSQR